jgi:hypothetical protein
MDFNRDDLEGNHHSTSDGCEVVDSATAMGEFLLWTVLFMLLWAAMAGLWSWRPRPLPVS